jgi:hypothetical protein|tara:strand:+ start:1476 stop:1715 length:240 start_codon:yes stop_codon:yes gene_type:complete
MEICLLTTQDLDADPFPEDDWPCDPRPFLPEASWHLTIVEHGSSVETVTARVQEGFDQGLPSLADLGDTLADSTKQGRY